MRRVIERIWLMHEKCILENSPIQEKVLWLNIQYAIKHSKSRSTKELGITKIPKEPENKVIFKVVHIKKKSGNK